MVAWCFNLELSESALLEVVTILKDCSRDSNIGDFSAMTVRNV